MPIRRTKIETSQHIFKNVPKEAEITRIEYEGPALAVYTKKPEVLVEQSYIVSDIVSLIRKRIVIRSDPSVRLPEQDSEKLITELIPKDAEVTNVNFDPSLGEVIVEAKKPGVVIGKSGTILQEIIREPRL